MVEMYGMMISSMIIANEPNLREIRRIEGQNRVSYVKDQVQISIINTYTTCFVIKVAYLGEKLFTTF